MKKTNIDAILKKTMTSNIKKINPRTLETAQKINAIQCSTSNNFEFLFKLSGLPNGTFRNKTLRGIDLSNSNLSFLDLTGTKIIDCNTNNTIFPESFNKKLLWPNHEAKITDGLDISNNLLVASQYGYDEIILSLIQKGHDVNVENMRGSTPLIFASRAGYISTIEILLENGADIDHKCDKRAMSALMWALHYEQEAVARYLVQKGANIHDRNTKGWTPLMIASKHGYDAVVRLMIEKGADIEETTIRRHTAFLICCQYGQDIVARRLIQAKANINVIDSAGWTPLMDACEEGHFRIVRLLLDHNVKLDPKNNESQTALAIAKSKGFNKIADLLIKHGAKMAAVFGMFSFMFQLL